METCKHDLDDVVYHVVFTLFQDSWRACVSFVVGRSLEDEELIQALALQPPQRKLFTSLTLDSTITMVKFVAYFFIICVS